jgi:hypothetical protein
LIDSWQPLFTYQELKVNDFGKQCGLKIIYRPKYCMHNLQHFNGTPFENCIKDKFLNGWQHIHSGVLSFIRLGVLWLRHIGE